MGGVERREHDLPRDELVASAHGQAELHIALAARRYARVGQLAELAVHVLEAPCEHHDAGALGRAHWPRAHLEAPEEVAGRHRVRCARAERELEPRLVSRHALRTLNAHGERRLEHLRVSMARERVAGPGASRR